MVNSQQLNADTPSRIVIQRRLSALQQSVTRTEPQSEAAFLESLSRGSGVPFRRIRGTRGGLEVLTVPSDVRATEIVERLRKRSDILTAFVDGRKSRHALPNDSLFVEQWYLQNVQPAAIGATVAWDTTTGSAGTVIAVLDTGVRFDHPDLALAAQSGKLLPGYDFIGADGGGNGNQFLTANDGNGRDPDPTDPGDWIDSNDRQRSFFSNCVVENSSWHGTRVAGLIAANTQNQIGIAGVSWQSWILPVRVLGKCGGYDSDILDAMRWSAGLPIGGVPTNPYPAKIINLSLGSNRVCAVEYQTVIQELTQLGVLVVVSAGNSGGPVEEPANCPGVVAVAGLRHAGTKVGYSSLGPEVTLSAPAGNCVNTFGPCLFALNTTYDIGRTAPMGPGYTDQFNTNLGTSFSAPLVAGVGALMHGVNARLATHHLIARLKESARPFPNGGAAPPPTCHIPAGPNDLQPAECVCTTDTCGAGMLYAPTAVDAARRPIASITAPANVSPGATINIDASTSIAACNRSLTTYLWTVVSASGTPSPTLSNANQAALLIEAPNSGSYTLRLTVTDDQGATDSGDITIAPSAASVTTTAPLTTAACPVAIDSSQQNPPIQPPVATPNTTPNTLQDDNDGGGKLGIELLFALLAIYLVRPNSSCRKS